MSRKDELKDRLMDELLREDARGATGDEKLLTAVEAAIDGGVEAGKVTPIRDRRSRAPYAWAAAVTVSAASVLGYLGWRAAESDLRMDELAGAPRARMDEMAPALSPAPAEGGKSAPGEREAPPIADLARKSVAMPPVAGPVAEAVLPAPQREEADAPVDHLANLPSDESRLGGKKAAESKRESDFTLAKKVPSRPSRMDPAARGPVPVPAPRPPQEGSERVQPDAGWGGLPGRNAPPVDRENYGQLVDQPWKTPTKDRFSTFSVDVDTASYANIRRMLQEGARVPADAVRIEECINYFGYRYDPPTQGGPFAVHIDMATCPWAEDHRLMKVGLKGMEVPAHKRPSSNLVFLIDVSGSMQGSKKLPLLVESMKVLVEELDERDRVGIVVYAGSEGVVLEPTYITEDGRGKVLAALNNLRAGGSTNGGAGITRAYSLAQGCFVEGGTNRVILATDGDFNVGTTGQGDLVKLVKDRAQSGVFLSVLGFGSGNINDSMLEAITNNGNGNYHYIDSQKEGRKVFLKDLTGTLVTIAKDVKIQVDFNPGKVQAYRLIGYANRILRDEDFNNDKIDAGDIGAGHTVTALYEIVPMGAPSPAVGGVDASKYDQPEPAREPVASDDWLTVKLRYKRPDGDTSTKMEVPVAGEPVAWEAADGDFQFAAGVALFGMKLRQSSYVNDAGWDLVRELARRGSAHDLHGYRAEFRTLVDKAAGGAAPRPVPAVEAPRAE